MKDLLVFYLMTSAIQIAPLVVIALSLQFGSPFSFLRMALGDWPLNGRNRRRNHGTTQLERACQVFDSNIKDCVARFALIVCILQVITIVLIGFAIEYDVLLPLVGNINGNLSPSIVFELSKFSVITAVLQLTPTFLLVLALIHGIPIPFMPNRVLSNPGALQEESSQNIISMYLTRIQNSEETYISVSLHHDESGNDYQLVFCQYNEVGASTQCYLYRENVGSLEQVIPSPVTVTELDEIFFRGYY